MKKIGDVLTLCSSRNGLWQQGRKFLFLAVYASMALAISAAEHISATEVLLNSFASQDGFGESVAISGNKALVSSWKDDGNGMTTGSAYLFDASTGQPYVELMPNDKTRILALGKAVALDGLTALVGAPNDDYNGNNSGSVYVFNAKSGEQLAKLTPSDGSPSEYFGDPIALDNQTAIVGVPTDYNNGSQTGSAYIFNLSTETQLKLVPPDGTTGDLFGISVAIDDNIALVGAIGDDDNGTMSGSAYLFNAITGEQIAKLFPGEGHPEDLFGFRVAIAGDRAVVSAPYEDGYANVSNTGAVYVFDISTGEQQFKWTPEDIAQEGNFGMALALNSDIAAIAGNANSGEAVYLLDIMSGQQIAKLASSDAAQDDHFGHAVAMSANALIVGALKNDNNGRDSGSAYVYSNLRYKAGLVGPRDFVYGMWNWDASILGDNERIQEMILFCLDLGITEVSFALNWNHVFASNPNNIPNLENLIGRLHDNGIRIELMVGDPSWIFHPDAANASTPEGGEGYYTGLQMIRRFIAYQNERYMAAVAARAGDRDGDGVVDCHTCFDGIRLHVDLHRLREKVTNGMLPANDSRRIGDRSNDSLVAMAGMNSWVTFNGEPLLFYEWVGQQLDKNRQLQDVHEYRETSVAVRSEILLRYWEMLKRYKALLQDPTLYAERHIIQSPAAVARYLAMATDESPSHWTVGVQDQNGNLLRGSQGDILDLHPRVVHAGEQIEVFKAILHIPDKITLVGCRDHYEYWEVSEHNEIKIDWQKSFKQWHTGNRMDGKGPRGALPYLQLIGKPVSVSIETIAESALASNSDYMTFADDSYATMKITLERIATELKSLYPAIIGIRYHEYVQSIPGKPLDVGEKYATFSTWAKEQIFAVGNLSDWQQFHQVTSATKYKLLDVPSVAFKPDPTNPDGPLVDTLSLEFDREDFKPKAGLQGRLTANIVGLPGTTMAGDFYVAAYLKILGGDSYYQGGMGYPDDLTDLDADENGRVNHLGAFTLGPIQFAEQGTSLAVWWLDVHNANGRFIRRFVLDPIAHCDSSDRTTGCIELNNLPLDYAYNPTDPQNISVAGILPMPAPQESPMADLEENSMAIPEAVPSGPAQPSQPHNVANANTNDTNRDSVESASSAETQPVLNHVDMNPANAAGWVKGTIINMPTHDTFVVKTWVKSDKIYIQGEDTSVGADGNFHAERLFNGQGNPVFVTLHVESVGDKKEFADAAYTFGPF